MTARDVVTYFLWVALLLSQVRLAIAALRARNDWAATASIVAAALAVIQIAREVS